MKREAFGNPNPAFYKWIPKSESIEHKLSLNASSKKTKKVKPLPEKKISTTHGDPELGTEAGPGDGEHKQTERDEDEVNNSKGDVDPV